MNGIEEIAAIAARLVVEEGMEYGAAKRRAGRDVGGRVEMPSNENVEDAVFEHIALFCADSQPGELRALRDVAVLWMDRLAEFRPHVSGAVWRGTATRWSAVQLDLYCDDPKAAEIALINAGVDYDTGVMDRSGPRGREPMSVLSVSSPSRALGEPVTVHLLVHDFDEQRGALKPDARGRSWRGDLAALRQRMQEPA
jgi:hypothetical protein